MSWQPPAYCLLLLLLYSRSVNKSCKYIVILVTSVCDAVLSCSSIASLQSLWLLMVLCILDFETNITVDVCWHYSLHSVLPISAVNVTLCCLLSVVHVTWFELLMSTAFFPFSAPVCCWRRFDWSFAPLLAPVVTTISAILRASYFGFFPKQQTLQNIS